jgi:hypothetical protein
MLCELAEFCKTVAKGVILRMANLRFCEVARELFGMYRCYSCSGLFFQKTLNIREKIHAIFDRRTYDKIIPLFWYFCPKTPHAFIHAGTPFKALCIIGHVDF